PAVHSPVPWTPLASPRHLPDSIVNRSGGPPGAAPHGPPWKVFVLIGWLEAIVLGVLQGLTEFLPVSSSAHVRVVSAFFGWQDPGAAFTAVIQLGTETAVLIYFRKRIWDTVSTWTRSLWTPALRQDQAAKMGWFVIAGSVPIGVLGLAFKEQIETVVRDLRLVGACLIVFGLLLAVADHFARNELTLDKHLNLPHALTYGLAQSLALIPGVSRSGGTTGAGLLLGYRREE